MFKKAVLSSLFVLLPITQNAAYAIAPEYQSLSTEQREAIYEAEKADPSSMAWKNLIPFAPGSMEKQDYLTPVMVGFFDVAAISLASATVSSALKGEPHSDFGLFIAAIIVPSLYLVGHTIGVATPWSYSAVYNQNLKKKLGLSALELGSLENIDRYGSSSFTKPSLSYRTHF